MRRARRPLLRCAPALVVLALASLGMPAQVLPPPPAPPARGNRLSAEPRVFVRGFVFEGNSVFSEAELAAVTAPFANRELGTGELEEARRAVTLHYVNQGYINSGALIPDQDPMDGMILLRIVEGRLSGIDLAGNDWVRDEYVRARVRRWAGAPLNVSRLQDGLQRLRQNPNVRQINAELKPGTAPGESVLDLKIDDQQPFRFGLQVDNQRPPSVGEGQLWLLASDLNLTGNSDVLDLRYGLVNSTADGVEMSGADNMEASYALPLNRFDTTLGLSASRLNTSIVEDDFSALDIESLTGSYGVQLRQPVHQTSRDEVALSVGFDYRENESWLLGEPFNISPGAVDGRMVASVLRFSQEWVERGQNHVVALRSTVSFGLDAFEATDSGVGGEPDADFVHWVGQGQYLQRLFNTQNQLVLRLTGQWSAEPLLALEQFSVGGFDSVRGYPENQMVRDRGYVSSVEFRLPVIFNKAGAGVVQLAPFFDVGGAQNVVDSPPGPDTICSTGIGLLVTPNRHVSAQIYWGYRLREVEISDDAGAQELGLSFKLILQAF